MALPEKSVVRKTTRRRFLSLLGTGFGASAAVVGWTLRVEPHWFAVVEQKLVLTNLPENWVGKRLLQLSDFHIGQTDSDYLKRAIQQACDTRPDAIVLTGDFIDHNSASAFEEFESVFSAVRETDVPVVACLGNHDYGRWWRQNEVATNVASALKKMGVQVLRDESVAFDGLTFVGLDDFWTPTYSSAKARKALSASSHSQICLCHNPDVCDEPIWGNFTGVILAGHTHGGQCKPPFFPPPRLPVRNRTYVAGYYPIAKNRMLYINRGLGHSLRARFNCRPEITFFTLQNASMT